MWTIEILERIAKRFGWRLNQDKNLVISVLKGLNESEELYGRYYCPCKIVSGNRLDDAKIICPCASAESDITEHGTCHCELYVKE